MKVRHVILLALLLSVQAAAQPVLTFTRIVNNWPTIELYFKATCDGKPTYIVSKKFISIRENGNDVGDFTLWCPDPRQSTAISVGLVLDCGLQAVQDSSQIREYAHDFVNLFDGIIDEAAVVYAGDTASVAVDMTTNKRTLFEGIQLTYASGPSRIYDAIHTALQNVLVNGSNPMRAVFAFVTGPDSGSIHSKQDIAILAQRNRIKVFCLGYGDLEDFWEFQELCHLTGGTFILHPDFSDLLRIYKELRDIPFIPFFECLVTYDASCMDGSRRVVDFTIENYCHAGSDVKTLSYRAPRDTSTFTHYTLELGQAEMSGRDVIVPVVLSYPDQTTLLPAEVVLSYSNTEMKFAGLADADIPLFWQAESAAAGDSLVTLNFPSPFPVVQGRTLFRLRFTPRNEGVYPSSMQIAINGWEGNCTLGNILHTEVAMPAASIRSATPTLARVFSISPNPTSGAFNVALEFERPTAFSLHMVNVLGQTVYNRAVNEKMLSYNGTIQLADAVPGVYFFMLECGGAHESRTVVVR